MSWADVTRLRHSGCPCLSGSLGESTPPITGASAYCMYACARPTRSGWLDPFFRELRGTDTDVSCSSDNRPKISPFSSRIADRANSPSRAHEDGQVMRLRAAGLIQYPALSLSLSSGNRSTHFGLGVVDNRLVSKRIPRPGYPTLGRAGLFSHQTWWAMMKMRISPS